MPNDQATAEKIVDLGDGRIVSFPGNLPDEAIGSAIRSSTPTQFEQERDPTNQPGFLRTAWNDVKSMAPTEAGASDIPILGPAISAAQNIAQAGKDYGQRKQEGRSPLYNAASTAVEGSGLFNPRGMEEASNVGNKAGVLGHAAVPAALAASPLIGEGAARLAAEAGPRIATAARTPEGALKPSVKLAGQVGGAGIGAATGAVSHTPYGPFAGAAAGYKVGPSLLDAAIPNLPPKDVGPAFLPKSSDFYNEQGAFMNRGYKSALPEVAPPQPELGSPENPGFHAKLPATMPKVAEVAPPPDELSQAVKEGRAAKLPARVTPPKAPVDVDPVAQAVKEGRAARIPTRMPSAPPPEAPAFELGSPQNPGFHAKLPARMPRPAAVEGAAAAPKIVTPSETAGEPRFMGSEGRPATWTNDAVMRLARAGNREAIQQVTRRGLQLPENSRYIMGDADYPRGVYNPRETTKFEPDNTPIRNKQNPRRP